MNYFEAYMEEKSTEAIAVQPPRMPAVAIIDEQVERLITLGANAEQLERLLALKERQDKEKARRAFYEAMLEVKSHPPEITKSKPITLKPGGQPAYFYAPLEEVCAAIIPALAAHGITHRWEVSYDGDWMHVSCILTHSAGHSEATTMRGKADTTGSKNQIQSEGSTKTYLERYTLLGAVGLAAAGIDNDATSMQPERKPLPRPPEKKQVAPPPPPASAPQPIAEKPKAPATWRYEFHRLAKRNKYSDDQIKNFMGSLGYEHTRDIPDDLRDKCMEWAGEAPLPWEE